MSIQPYLFFNGRTDEAIEFYRQALGAKVEMRMTFREAPQQPPPGMLPPGLDDKVMHSSLRIGDSVIMASDGPTPPPGGFHGFSLSIPVADEAEADRVFNALVEGGKVTMPLGKTFFSPRFGTLIDRFGVHWMVIVPAPMPN